MEQNVLSLDVAITGPLALQASHFTGAIKPGIPWRQDGDVFEKTLMYSGEVPFNLRLGIWSLPDAPGAMARASFRPRVLVLAFDLHDVDSLRDLERVFSAQNLPGVPEPTLVLLGVHGNHGKAKGVDRTLPIQFCEANGVEYYFETDMSRSSVKKLAYLMIRTALEEIREKTPGFYRKKRDEYRRFAWQYKKENPPPRRDPRKKVKKPDPQEEEDYRRRLLEAWKEWIASQTTVSRELPGEGAVEGGDAGSSNSVEERRRRALDENYFAVEDAKAARSRGDLDKARVLLLRSLEICEEWGLEGGARWAHEQVREIEGEVGSGSEKNTGE
ncbi:MAG: hypothetical protein ACTSU5_12965 [Promethearchaeota archaeon]